MKMPVKSKAKFNRPKKVPVILLVVSIVINLSLFMLPGTVRAASWIATSGPGTDPGSGVSCGWYDSANGMAFIGEGNGGHVWRYSENAGSWTDIGNPGGQALTMCSMIVINGAAFAGPNVYQTGMGVGTVYRNANPYAGSTWEDTNCPAILRVFSMTTDGTNLWTGSADGYVYRNGNPVSSASWISLGNPSGGTEGVYGILYGNNNLYAASANGHIYKNSNPASGTHWTDVGSPDGSEALCLAYDGTSLYTGTHDGGIFKNASPATGSSWTRIGTLSGDAVGVSGLVYDSVNNNLYAETLYGYVYKNIDPQSGSTWLDMGDVYPCSDLHYGRAVLCNTADNLLYAGALGDDGGFLGLLYYTNLPTAVSVSPNSGKQGTNMNVVITGKDTEFSSDAEAHFSGTGITVNSTIIGGGTGKAGHETQKTLPIEVTANITIAQDATPDARDVWVTYNNLAGEIDKTDVLSGGFTVTPVPMINSISPASGPPGTEVTINGSGFGLTQGNSTVMVDGLPATVVSWSDTEIVIIIPSGATTGAVIVTTGSGGSNRDKIFEVTSASSTWYLAEGTTAWGFNTYITIANPNDEELTARITYMDPHPKSGSGIMNTRDVPLAPQSQTTVDPRWDIDNVDFATKVTCLEDKTIAVDRTMTWTGGGASSPEGHNSTGATTPSATWYLPEGSSDHNFETWTLVLNPNNVEASVELTYMTETLGQMKVNKVIPPLSRATYSMFGDIGAADSSIKVSSDVPVVAERSMYRNNRREGSCSVGTDTPSEHCFLAEGTTAWGFTTYVLVQNPNDNPAEVTVIYMTTDGPKEQPKFSMPANSRKTIRVNDAIKDYDCSTMVESNFPVIAERAMYWGNGEANEAMHDSIGLASAHMSFYLPDGQSSNSYETYTLVQNPNPGSVRVQVTYLLEEGSPVSFTDEIPPASRKTYTMADKIESGRAAIMVESLDGARPIMVERSMYWNNRGAGTDTVGGFNN